MNWCDILHLIKILHFVWNVLHVQNHPIVQGIICRHYHSLFCRKTSNLYWITLEAIVLAQTHSYSIHTTSIVTANDVKPWIENKGAALLPSRILFGLCRQKNGVRLTTGLNCIPIEIMALVQKYRISNSVEKFIPNFVENNSIFNRFGYNTYAYIK